MSYGSTPIDEIPTKELSSMFADEMVRRHGLAVDHKCGYCKQSLSTHTCKYAGAVEPFHDIESTTKSATLGRLADAFEAFSGLTFADLRLANVERCEKSFHTLKTWSPADWATALAGECGEACNMIKKMRRIANSPETITQSNHEAYRILLSGVAKELADVVTYADLLAARLGIDLGEAVRNKFNEISDRVGSNVKL